MNFHQRDADSRTMLTVLTVLLVFLGVVSILGLTADSLLSQRRIYAELKEVISEGLTLDVPFNSSADECGVRLSPMKRNIFEWHFSFLGVEGSPFDNGIYHGTILLDKKYPRKAPTISINTPSGRWKVDTNICLSASAHHPELWDPSWNLRTLVLSLRGFMTTNPGEIGSLPKDPVLQKRLAIESRRYICRGCGVHHSDLVESISEGDKLVQPTTRSVLAGKLLLNLHRGTKQSGSGDSTAPSKVLISPPDAPRSSRKKRKTTSLTAPSSLSRVVLMRKVMLYSGTILLLGAWKCFVDAVDRYFTAESASRF